MSQQPPTGSAGTPEDPASDAESTQRFDQSPYDVPEPGPAGSSADTVAMSPPAYGQAPDPTRTIYSETTTTDPEGAPEVDAAGRPRWVVPVVIAVILLLVIGGVVAAYLLGDDDPDPAPVAPTATEEATDGAPTPTPEATEADDATEEAEDATDEATAEATEEPTDEATEEATEELLEDLEDSVTFENRATGEEITFTVGDDGFSADDDIIAAGALEAWVGRYEAGDEEIDMLATQWSDNDAADAYAEELLEAIDGQEVETGHTYTTRTGTYWAYVLEDGQGRYVWTTDRGHVLQVTGSADHVSGFYSNYPL